jgi:membrane protein YqaA with SNARE-associated domain
MWVVVKAAAVGALVGFAIGWTLGFLWEHRHRRRRARQAPTMPD